MKREIKFRTWFENKMHYLDIYETTNYQPAFVLREIDIDESWIDDHVKKPESPLMQYTGFKDKNGKEIYEGDICSKDRHTEKYEVVFYKGAWAIKNETQNAIWTQEFCNGIDTRFLSVITNIYENKELLSNIVL